MIPRANTSIRQFIRPYDELLTPNWRLVATKKRFQNQRSAKHRHVHRITSHHRPFPLPLMHRPPPKAPGSTTRPIPGRSGPQDALRGCVWPLPAPPATPPPSAPPPSAPPPSAPLPSTPTPSPPPLAARARRARHRGRRHGPPVLAARPPPAALLRGACHGTTHTLAGRSSPPRGTAGLVG